MSEFKGTTDNWLVADNLIYCDDYFQTHIAIIPDSFSEEIKKANAKLIASAPEMLEMLNLIVNTAHLNNQLSEKVNILIKKATT